MANSPYGMSSAPSNYQNYYLGYWGDDDFAVYKTWQQAEIQEHEASISVIEGEFDPDQLEGYNQ